MMKAASSASLGPRPTQPPTVSSFLACTCAFSFIYFDNSNNQLIVDPQAANYESSLQFQPWSKTDTATNSEFVFGLYLCSFLHLLRQFQQPANCWPVQLHDGSHGVGCSTAETACFRDNFSIVVGIRIPWALPIT